MYKIDDPTCSTSEPALPTDATVTPGWFIEGNAATGTAPTRVRGWWLNMIQDELANVVIAAGIAFVKGTNNQLLAALRSLFNVVASYGSVNNGTVTFPGGVVDLTMTTTVPCINGTETTTVTLLVPFATNCLDALVCFDGTSPPTQLCNISVQPLSKTQVSVTTTSNASGTVGVVIRARGN